MKALYVIPSAAILGLSALALGHWPTAPAPEPATALPAAPSSAGGARLWRVNDRAHLVTLPNDLRRVAIDDVSEAEGGGLTVVLSTTHGDVDGKTRLEIYIGELEAVAIARALYGLPMPRPMTHDLLQHSIEALGGEVEAVTVTRLSDGIYYGAVSVRIGERLLHIDARPSDSIALAVRTDAKIFVSAEVLRQAGLEGRQKAPPVEPRQFI
jgi:hypothetical protein